MELFILDDAVRDITEQMCDKDLEKAQLSYVKLLYGAHVRCGRTNERVGAAIPVPAEDEKLYHAAELCSAPGSTYKSPKWRKVEFRADDPYSPAVTWVSNAAENYLWMLALTESVWTEYKYRFQRPADGSFFHNIVFEAPSNLKARYSSPVPPPQTVPDIFKDSNYGNGWVICIRANRDFYRLERKHERWTRRNNPEWMKPPPKPGDAQVEVVMTMGRLFKTYKVTTVGA